MDWSSTAAIDWNNKAHIVALSEKVRAYISSVHGSVTDRQKAWGDDPGVKGPAWVSRCTLPPPPEADALHRVLEAVDSLNDGCGSYVRPGSATLETQWTGHRAGVDDEAPEPSISEKEKYSALMREVTSPVTIFYIYGGAFCLGGPARCRKYAVELAKATGGRCFAVRYRLAPQNPFPAALLDVFLAYLSLLAPPPGSYHEAVPAPSIVLTGDSSGSSLALSLVQLLLTIRRQDSMPTVRYHGQDVPVTMPAGLTAISNAADHTLCLPSERLNAKYDVFNDGTRFTEPGFPVCQYWPTKPPRGHIYCESSMLCHPFVSPAAARDWRGAPPMWFVSGQDRSTDSTKVVVQMAARQGVCVFFEEYEAMPHSWPMLFSTSPQSRRCFKKWAQVCNDFVSINKDELKSRTIFVEVEGMKERETNPKELIPLEIEDVLRLMKHKSKKFKTFTGGIALPALL